MSSKKTTRAVLAAVIGNSIFGLSFLASKVALTYAEPTVMLTARFGVAFLILSVLALFKVIRIELKGKPVLPLIALGICQPVIYFIGESYGIQYTTASFSGVMIGLIPVAAFLLSAVFLKEGFSGKKFFWVLGTVAGVAFISISEKSAGTISMKGVAWLMVAIVSSGAYNLISRSCAEKFTPIERTYMMFVMGFVAFFVMGMVQTRGALPSVLMELAGNPGFLGSILYLAVFSSIIAFFCLNYAVSYLPVQTAASFTNLTSIVSVAAGVLIMGDPFSLFHAIGIGLILVSIFQINKL